MSDLPISPNIHSYRDNWGQFASQIDSAVADTMRDVAAEGARVAEGLAPPGLAGTFDAFPIGRLAWAWGSNHQWAEGLNSGIPEHLIGRPGQFLRNRQEGTGPGGVGHFQARGPVLHPGVRGTFFMERSFEAVEPDVLPALREQVSTAVRGF